MVWSYFDSLLIAVISIFLIAAPYTKVEESFSIQAIHDILKYGIFDISKYDHLQFSGAVPRSFIGPLIIAALTKPFTFVSRLYNNHYSSSEIAVTSNLETQLLVRCMVGLTNALSMIYLKNSVKSLFEKKFEKEENEKENGTTRTSNSSFYTTIDTWFNLFVLSSFHLMFYASRTLPNLVITLPLTNIALAWVLSDNYNHAIALLAFTSIIFRLEVAALGVSLTCLSLYFKKISFYDAFKFGVSGLTIGGLLTLLIDSYFWKAWTIPEFDAFIFNVIEGSASKWGTESPLAYFTHYLRMMFIPPTVLFLNYFGFKMAPKNLKIMSMAAYCHILILSLQPHKEWRFIIYSIPPIILLGSTAAAYLWENFEVISVKSYLLMLLLPLSPVISFLFSMVFLYVSRLNYPGGEALTNFNSMIVKDNIKNVTVHISIPPCMTGVTLFGQLEEETYHINYDRTEDYETLKSKWPHFDYLITNEPAPEYLPSFNDQDNSSETWEIVQTTQMFSGINIDYIQELLFKEDQNALSFITNILLHESILEFTQDVMKNVFKTDDVFFTYKRIKSSEGTNSEHVGDIHITN
ncbi:dolichyl-P-Man:Man(7)GlcNAc(2)-PP-dolichol alpha-1,6-mannosyltransferase NDAI_0K02210 [Naumovozyma dairenensis CBS 421]|uniref:Mannosyltransferase n=1 Tax=Naumovozyma dairenensis (strain ATCC 10597 / BCRC 20456 / CBS 421 / NBRC 0211 / NRRL Y-12639) TaxID=1071378 RepID=G0WI01_NAUDC|nr:hypothetical protein NDAI_0K02210 [Naumovozyma dairenensis CBS 421]CCD27412.1 hypothetical protein NDAI_0K02210 [Naumovozyma dairenensis CBS 421]